VLARGAATEIIAGDQNLRLAIGGLVENEVGVFAAVVAIAFLREQALAKSGALDGAATPSKVVNFSMSVARRRWYRPVS
jgi:hypothetical protein